MKATGKTSSKPRVDNYRPIERTLGATRLAYKTSGGVADLLWDNSPNPFGLCALLLAVFMCVCGGACLLAPAISSANTPITFYSAVPSNGEAGGHPDVEINVGVANRLIQSKQSTCNCEDAKDATIHFPAGFIGNPHSTPQCTLAEFSGNTCPIDSQVGITNVGASVPGLYGIAIPFNAVVYNVVPPPTEAGLLGFKVYGFNTPVFTVLSARTGTDFGLDAEVSSIAHVYPLLEFQQILWGVPASPSHDALRLSPTFRSYGGPYYTGELCNANGEPTANEEPGEILHPNPSEAIEPCRLNGYSLPPLPSSSPEIPFLQNPSTCGSPLTSELDLLSYDGGETEASSPWPEIVGCDQLSFNPSLYAQPTSSSADTPSGIDIDLEVPQEFSPTVPSPSELRAATVTLPEGFTINPNAADGKVACTNSEALIGPAFASEEEAHCPEYSKVGSLTIESSALPGPLPGYVYLGQPEPGSPYRLFLIANGFATHVKLAGTVTPDPATGRLVISFDELPETPLTSFRMHFFGSERGLLATPTQCGEYPVDSIFTPWDASLSTQNSTQFFTLTSGPDGTPCPGSPRPFHPGFQGVSLGHTAGAHSPFTVEVTRNDGDQNLTGVSVTTPPGFLATLAGVAYCPRAGIEAAEAASYSGADELANPSCPLASQIGTAVTGAGAGNHPVYVAGKVYLSGPYKGAPLSLVVITPAISGPYDLGNAVVRVALNINPETAQITAASDPLPEIMGGIPLRLRSIRIELNRGDFALDPTNCAPFAVSATVGGNQGAEARLSEHFQMANCGTLPFAPTLALSLTGPTTRAKNPSLHAILSAKGGEAGIARTMVSLPRSELIDNAHIKDPCTRVQFAEGATPGEHCPSGSMIGYAKAETPLLEKPLEGPVFLRSAPENKSGLPDIVAALNGQINIDLDGKINTVNGRLQTNFSAVPDAPVTKFMLTLDGGNKGLLQNSINLCKSPLSTLASLAGQNGKVDHQNQRLAVPCRKSAKRRQRKSTRVDNGTRGGKLR